MMITTREQLIRTSRVAASMLPNTRGGTATVAIPTSFQTTSKHQDRQHLDGISEAEERQGRHHGGTLTHPSFTRDAASFCGRVRPTVHRDRFHLRPDGAGCFADKHDYFALTRQEAHQFGANTSTTKSRTTSGSSSVTRCPAPGTTTGSRSREDRAVGASRSGGKGVVLRTGFGPAMGRGTRGPREDVIHSTWSGDGVCPGPFAQKRGEELC